MLSGKPPGLKPDTNDVSSWLSPAEQAFVAYLHANPQTIEVLAAVNALLFDVEVTARNPVDGEMELRPSELDSGTWLLVRISPLPTDDARGGLIPLPRPILSTDKELEHGMV